MKNMNIIFPILVILFGIILFDPKTILAKEESEPLSIESEFHTNAEGVTTISGKTVSNATVKLKGSSTISDDDGNFTLKYTLKKKKNKKSESNCKEG